jgi:hypothetical protein
VVALSSAARADGAFPGYLTLPPLQLRARVVQALMN